MPTPKMGGFLNYANLDQSKYAPQPIAPPNKHYFGGSTTQTPQAGQEYTPEQIAQITSTLGKFGLGSAGGRPSDSTLNELSGALSGLGGGEVMGPNITPDPVESGGGWWDDFTDAGIWDEIANVGEFIIDPLDLVDTHHNIGDLGERVIDPLDMVQTSGDLSLPNLLDDPGQYVQDLADVVVDPGDAIHGAGINDFQNDVSGLIDDTGGNIQSLWDDTRGNVESLIDDTQGNIGEFIETGGLGGGGGGMGPQEGGYSPFGEKALDYLMDFEQLPREYRDQALPSLYGMTQEGFNPSYDQLTSDPLYQSQLRAGEEAALRHGAVTGGKRGTDINRSLAANSQGLLEDSYNRQLQDRMRKQQGLQGFAFGQPNNTNQISNLMLGIDENAINQQTAQAQMEQARMGQLLGGGSALLSGLLGAFSDPKLKEDVDCIGEYKGLNWCRWIWNKSANKLGLAGVGYGVMADEVEAKYPELSGKRSGYRTVNYGGLINA